MKIITDLAADLTPEDIAAYDVALAPLFIQFPDGEVNAADITPDDFYDRLRAMYPKIPTTSLPSPGQLADIYRDITRAGAEAIAIHISSGLSGTANSARLAAKQFTDRVINVVDSMTLSGAERFQVLAAARAVRAGWSFDQIATRLEALRQRSETIYTLDTLEYLAHGGRIGRVQALAGSLLNIKPLIYVAKEDGKYSTHSRVRTLNRALHAIGDYLADRYTDAGEALWVSVMHGQFAEQADKLADIVRQRLNIGKLEVLRISPILGVHTGPGIVGVCCAPLSLVQDF